VLGLSYEATKQIVYSVVSVWAGIETTLFPFRLQSTTGAILRLRPWRGVSARNPPETCGRYTVKVGTGIVLGCAGIAVVAIVVAGLIGAFFLHVSTGPEGLWLKAMAPGAVKVGETFKLVVNATNRLSDRKIRLGALDIPDTYLEGFAIVSVSPDPQSTELDDDGYTTTRFAVILSPGTTAEFQFELRAERVGQWRGQVDQYVGMQYLSAVVETTVSR